MISFYLGSFVFFFFKQNTAYEMRISDWSSDVCSSDLVMEGGNGLINRPNEAQAIVCWGHGSGQLFNCRQEPELRVRVDLVGFPQGIVSIDEDHCRTVAGGHLLFSALSSWASD